MSRRTTTARPWVEEVRSHHPDVVVTDNEMPVMTGLEVVQTLHDDPDNR